MGANHESVGYPTKPLPQYYTLCSSAGSSEPLQTTSSKEKAAYNCGIAERPLPDDTSVTTEEKRGNCCRGPRLAAALSHL